MNCPTCGSPVFPNGGTTPEQIVDQLGLILAEIEVSALYGNRIALLENARRGQTLILAALESKRPVEQVVSGL
jgi:hypothetical protein